MNVQGKWNYICVIIDLFNREFIGYAAGKNKNAELVYKAFGKIKANLNNINIFHKDRGNEFKNKIIDEVLTTFNIDRSLSKKGCAYDNNELIISAFVIVIASYFIKLFSI